MSTYLKASTSRRWHFCLLTAQKPPHPVGSSESRRFLHIGTSSSTRARHTSPSKQSSQYRVALAFWLAFLTSVSASVGPGNDFLLLKRVLMVNASMLLVFVVRVSFASARFGSSLEIAGVNDSPDVAFCTVNLSVDFRYCWMTWSFSGSEKKRCDQSREREPSSCFFRKREPRILLGLRLRQTSIILKLNTHVVCVEFFLIFADLIIYWPSLLAIFCYLSCKSSIISRIKIKRRIRQSSPFRIL